ncbi:GFA family protein [Roseomonas sp. WA12]
MQPGSGPIKGSCHCGAVRFEATLADGVRTARRCNCSMCRMRGAVVVSAALGGVRVTAGADKLATYEFNTRTAKHHFCTVCGIYTHHQRRSDPRQFGVNVACLEGMSPFDFPEVPVADGVNHPSDTGLSRLAGVLRFDPAEEG